VDPANLKIIHKGLQAFRRIRSQWFDALDDGSDRLTIQ
jgi:hypothetical protein